MADEDSANDSGPDLDDADIDSLEQAANEQAGASPEQSSASAGAAAPVPESEVEASAATAVDETAEARDGASAEELLDEAEQNLDRVLSDDLKPEGDANPADGAKSFEFDSLGQAAPGAGAASPLPIDALDDVELDLRIELGRTELLIEDVVKLGEGSIVQLDKLAGDPVDVLVNGRLVARGEVLVLNDNFCIRVVEILTPESN